MNDFLKGLISTYKYSEEFENQKLMATDSIQASYSFDNTSFYRIGLRYIEVLLDNNAKLLKSTLYIDFKFLCGESLDKEVEIIDGFEVDNLVVISNDENLYPNLVSLSKDLDFYKFEIDIGDSRLHFSNSFCRVEDLEKAKITLNNYPDNSIQLALICSLNDYDFLNYFASSPKISNLCLYFQYFDNMDYLNFLKKMSDLLHKCKLDNFNHTLFLDYDPLESNLVNLKHYSLNKEIISLLDYLTAYFVDVHVISSKLMKKSK